MAEALADLHAALTGHFNAEEKPAGCTTPSACAPRGSASPSPSSWTTTSASPASCATCVSGARAAEGTAADSLRGDVARLLAMLADHERREHDMVKAASGA